MWACCGDCSCGSLRGGRLWSVSGGISWSRSLVSAFLVSFFLGAGEASESLRAAGARRRLRGVIGSSTSSSEESLIETSAAFLLGSN